MKNIKIILLGLAIMILPNALHLYEAIGFLAGLVAIVGFFFVVAGLLLRDE